MAQQRGAPALPAAPGEQELLAEAVGAAEEQEQALREALGRSGADTLELATDDDLLDALLRYADLRRQRARLKTPLRFPAHLKQRAEVHGAAA